MHLMMARFAERLFAEEAFAKLKSAAAEKVIEPDDLALVYKSDDGKVHVEQGRHVSTRGGAGRGLALGALLGVATGGVATVAAAGAAAGGLIAHKDRGISNEVINRIGETIEGSEAVVFVSAHQDTVEKIKAHVDEQ